MKPLWIVAGAALLIAACAGGEPTTQEPLTNESSSPLPTPPPTTIPGASSATTAAPPSLPARPRATTTSAAPPERTGPVLDLFYAVHVHTQSEWAPFRDPELTELDVAAAQGFVDQVEAIAAVLERHAARGSFHFTFGTAAGLCLHVPEYFDDLEARGHEIGIHAHTDPFLLRAAVEMRTTCGREIGTGSGLAAMAGGPDGATRASLGASLAVFVDVGATQLLVNMSDECGTATGGGNDLTPWRADPADICAPRNDGIILIDQAPLEYVVFDDHPADIFGDAEFTALADLADAAVAETRSLPSDEIVTWGFVTHTNEYVRGASALAPPEQAALEGLDLLLTRLDPYVDAGLARWSTAAEIAARS